MHQPEPQTQSYPSLISGIENGTIKIPQFQREFVWSREKSAALIDSILRGYPIGTFILWRTKESLRAVRNIGGAKLPETPDGEFVNHVLDGQQRLTSLFATIRGLKVTREDQRVDDFGEIRVDLDAVDEEPLVIVGGEGREDYATVRVADLIEQGFKFFGKFPEKHHARIEECQNRLKSYLFSVILVKEAPIDVATEIFTRINEGGKPLSPFEIMVAKTYDAKRDFDLAEKTDALLEELRDAEYETIPETTILQVVATLLTKDCRKKAILNLKKDAFIDAWPRAVEAIHRAVDYFRMAYAIPASRLLPYPALLIPFAYFFDRHKHKPTGDAADRMRDLFWRVSLGGRYSFALETKVAQDVKRVDEILEGRLPKYEEVLRVDADFVWDNGFFRTGSAFVKAILCLLAAHAPQSFDDGSKVILDNDWLIQANSKNYHHFFPRAWLKKHWPDWESNNVANITIVDDRLNKHVIRDKSPSVYLKKLGGPKDLKLAARLKTHLINPDRDGVWDDDYERFIDRRCAAIAKELNKRLISQPDQPEGRRGEPDPGTDANDAFRENPSNQSA